MRIFLFHTLLPVILERSRGVLRVRDVIVFCVQGLCHDLGLAHVLAPHLRDRAVAQAPPPPPPPQAPNVAAAVQAGADAAAAPVDDAAAAAAARLGGEVDPDAAARPAGDGPLRAPGPDHRPALLAAVDRLRLAAHRGARAAGSARLVAARSCVAVLPVSLRVLVLVAVAAAAVVVSVVVSFGLPLVVGHRVVALGPEYLTQLSDAYMIAVGM